MEPLGAFCGTLRSVVSAEQDEDNRILEYPVHNGGTCTLSKGSYIKPPQGWVTPRIFLLGRPAIVQARGRPDYTKLKGGRTTRHLDRETPLQILFGNGAAGNMKSGEMCVASLRN